MTTQKILSRDFVIIFFAQFAFASVFFALVPTLPIYLSRLGSTNAAIGMIIGGFSISALVIRPLIGRALLKTSEKKIMVIGAIIFSLSSMAYLWGKPFWPLMTVRIAQGVGWAFFVTASLTLVMRITPEANRGQSVSYFFLAFNIAFALAPSFGIFLMNLINFSGLFFVCTGLSLCSLFLTIQLRKRPAHPLENSSIANQPFLSREALPPAILAFMGNIIWGAVTAFFPLYALSQGVTNPGFFFAVYASVLILCRLLGGRILDVYRREKLIFPCLFLIIIAMTILAFSTTSTMFLLVAVIWGLGNSFFFPSIVAYAIDLARSSYGPAIGTYLALSDLGTSIGSVIMGIVLQWSNYQIMFLSLAFIGFLNLCFFYFTFRKKGVDHHAHL
jgi:predicted MFS family arabinose efflux permease